MKKKLTVIIVSLILLSCSKNEFEKQLIGTWNNFPTEGVNDIKLYKDSVISYEYYIKRKGTWKANKSQIKFHFPQQSLDSRLNLNFDYKLSSNKDSLFLKATTDSIYTIPVLLKVNDVWKHYLKEVGLKIELPEADFELVKNNSTWYGVDLYLAYKNGDLKINNENGYGLNIYNDLRSFIFSERSIRKEEEIDKMNFNLIVDKAVSEREVDSIKTLLKEFPEMKIFRVFKKEDSNYGKYDLTINADKWHWYGRLE